MEEIEDIIQKKLTVFCKKFLPEHEELWNSLLKKLQCPIKALGNFAEQLRCVEKANINYLNNFKEIQVQLQIKILLNIEEEFELINQLMEKLYKLNQDLKNKLTNLEKLTVDLNWERNSTLIKGTPLQPPLTKIFQLLYELRLYYSNRLKTIKYKLKTLNVRDEKLMVEFLSLFYLNSTDNCKVVYQLLALTQYIM